MPPSKTPKRKSLMRKGARKATKKATENVPKAKKAKKVKKVATRRAPQRLPRRKPLIEQADIQPYLEKKGKKTRRDPFEGESTLIRYRLPDCEDEDNEVASSAEAPRSQSSHQAAFRRESPRPPPDQVVPEKKTKKKASPQAHNTNNHDPAISHRDIYQTHHLGTASHNEATTGVGSPSRSISLGLAPAGAPDGSVVDRTTEAPIFSALSMFEPVWTNPTYLLNYPANALAIADDAAMLAASQEMARYVEILCVSPANEALARRALESFYRWIPVAMRFPLVKEQFKDLHIRLRRAMYMDVRIARRLLFQDTYFRIGWMLEHFRSWGASGAAASLV